MSILKMINSKKIIFENLLNVIFILRKKKKVWQLPTFPQLSSIIGVRELDFRVRNGNGYYLSTMATRHLLLKHSAELLSDVTLRNLPAFWKT